MHGISHLYRQHAVEKQISSESWQNASFGYESSTESSANNASRLYSVDSDSNSSNSSSHSKMPNWSQGKLSKQLLQKTKTNKNEEN